MDHADHYKIFDANPDTCSKKTLLLALVLKSKLSGIEVAKFSEKKNEKIMTSIRLNDKRYNQNLLKFSISRDQWSLERLQKNISIKFSINFYSLPLVTFVFLVIPLIKTEKTLEFVFALCFKPGNFDKDHTLYLRFKSNR